MLQVKVNGLWGVGLLLALLAEGCGYRWEAVEVNADGDEYPADEDCWDAVEGPAGSGLSGADIYPGAEDDWYDGVDANCDGADDYDQDGDGSLVDEDCDDLNAAASPDLPERCTDGVDNDCDGLTDTADLDDGDGNLDSFEDTPFYLDEDRDGYGDDSGAQEVQQSCSAPPGYSVFGGDCDDGDEVVNPGAEELCDGADVDEDCDGASDDADPEGATGGDEYHPDGDGDSFGDEFTTEERCDPADGYTTDGTDCDDGDPDVNPDAAEMCDPDDVDEDCDGLADDADQVPVGPEGVDRYYPDSDGDSFGTDQEEEGLYACEAPDGYVDDNTDCDDLDSTMNPGAEEVCDSHDYDEDCDGVSDDADPSVSSDGLSTWYPDVDGDDRGDEDAAGVSACEDPGGMTRSHDDCDDGDATVYPGATEVCGDGVVSDCGADETDVRNGCVSLAALDSAQLSLGGNTADSMAGSTLSGGGDVSGDAMADMLVGAPDYSSSRGKVYLVSGATSLTASDLDSGALAYFTSDKTNDALGTAVADGGDVNGDGYADLLMTAPSEDSGVSGGGAAWLVLGPVSSKGLVDDAKDAVLLGDTTSLELGSAALLADVTGDDVADLIVGSTAYNISSTKTNVGAVYVIEGAPGSPTVSASAADLLFTGEKSGDRAGGALVVPGDMDGDGAADLGVGVPGNNDAADDAGKVWLLSGASVTGDGSLATEADYTVKGVAASDLAGSTLAAAGDADGDGYADLWVGAPGAGAGAGAVYLVKGAHYLSGTLGLGSAAATLSGDAGAAAGSAVAGLDVDLDGTPDVAVGAPAEDDGSSTDAGAVYIVYGSFSGSVSLSSADAIVEGGAAGDALGAAVVNAGDTNADGADDLLVGAPGFDSDTSLTDAGAIYLFSTWY